MEYQVPQFIEVEDKIVGPLTLRQFIYLAGGAGVTVACFLTLPFVPAALISLPVDALAGALAFYKVNGKSFVNIIEAGVAYFVGDKLFLWRREEPKVTESSAAAQAAAQSAQAASPTRATPKLTRGKLSELAWSLDVQSPPPSP